MIGRIFENLFFLDFYKKEMQVEYDETKKKDFLKYGKYISMTLMILSVAATVINTLHRDSDSSVIYKFIIYSSYINTFINYYCT
jgi:hypothetical protein